MKRGTPLPGNKPPEPALPAAIRQPAQLQAESNTPPAPAYRHTTKKPLTDTRPMGSTGIPHPRDTPATSDYWIREGNLWKRVHVQPRWDLYIPQQTDDGPDVTRLIQARTTFVRPTDGSRYYRIDDDWTTKRQATLNIEWTGSTKQTPLCCRLNATNVYLQG